jgi:hypothetical protein
MRSPIAAIAMTATAVALIPNAVPCTQRMASAIGLSAGGSRREGVEEYMGNPWFGFLTILKHDG